MKARIRAAIAAAPAARRGNHPRATRPREKVADPERYEALYEDIARMMPVSSLHPMIVFDRLSKYLC